MPEVINYSDIEQRMKGLKRSLPSRSELHSKPWDEEQLRFFIERQKNVPQILEKMGIVLVGREELTQ